MNQKVKYILLVFVLLGLYSFSAYDQEIINDARPNIILYLSDDQDKLDFGCYGNPNVKTSNVDKLASEGIKFNNFYTSQAICAPSRSQIFTGMYPVKNGCMANHIGVKPNVESITSLLKSSGYEVVLAGKSHVKPNKVFDWTYFYNKVNNRYLPLEKIDNYLKTTERPFCLIIASDYPHGPYPKTSNYTKEDIYKLPYDPPYIGNHKPGYYQNIEDDNDQLGAVIEMVDKHGHTNNTMFIYASDHGLSGKWGLEEKGIQVPFIVRWPGKISKNSESNTLLSLVDVLPTILDVTNTNIPDEIDGVSFKNTLLGKDDEVHDYIFGVATKQNIRQCKIFPSRMVRNHRYKLIRNYNSIEKMDSNLGDNEIVNEFIKIGAMSFPDKPFEELYDLMNDPYEKNNLANKSDYQLIKNELVLALDKWMLEQNDFILKNPVSLIMSPFHPLDKNTQWNSVPPNLLNQLKAEDYIKLHY